MKRNDYKFNRILASLIDGFVMFLIIASICTYPTIVLIRDLVNHTFYNSDALWLAFCLVGSFAVWILYLFLSALILKNATLGMRINHLVFVKSNGNNLTARTIILREAAVVFCIVFSLGFSIIFDPISMFCSENDRNFYDILSSTKVVNVNDLQ